MPATSTPTGLAPGPVPRRVEDARPGEMASVLLHRLTHDPWRLALHLLAVLHVVAVGILSAGGSLFIDDIRAQAYAAGRTWWPFVVESNGTHLAPGARTVDWLMATQAPLAHWPAVVLTVLVAAGYAAACTALVRTAVRDPRVRTLALAWVLFVPAVVPTFAWFRQALTTMLPLALVLAAVVLAVRFLRLGGRAPLAGLVLAHGVALTFSERALALPVVLAALVLAVRRTDGRRPLRRGVAALVSTVVLNLGFLAAYASGDFDRAERSSPGLADAAVKIGRWAAYDLLPVLVGGPGRWRPGNGAYSFADSPLPLVVASAVVVLGLVLAAVRTRGALRHARPVLLAAGAYALPVLAMVYVGRLAVVESVTAADDLRLLPDVTVACALGLAALVDGTVRHRSGRRAAPAPRRRAAALVVVAAVVLTAVSWATFTVRWHDTTVQDYLDTMRAEVRTGGGQVLPTTVPSDVVPGWVDPGFTTEPLLRLLSADAVSSAFDGPARVVGPSGALVDPRFDVVARAEVPDGFCGHVLPVGQRELTIPFRADVPYYRGSVVQLGLLVGDAERIDVRVTGRDGTTSEPLVGEPPELLRGPHRVLAQVPSGVAVTAVVVEVETENTAGVCVTSAQVVRVEAAS